MIDSVLKGTGNSRFLKSAVPAGTSWADALAMLQAGTFPIDFNGINTEGFQQVGTPLNKANLLKDATAAQIGLPTSTTPDGMFQALANTGELHVWRKTVVTTDEIPAGYTLGAKESNVVFRANSDVFGVVDVSSSIAVSSDGTVGLINPTTNQSWASVAKWQTNIRGKFVKFGKGSSSYITYAVDGIFYISENAVVSKIGLNTMISGMQPVNGYPLTPAGKTTTYPVSTNPNAYQEGTSAGTTIEYLGKLGDKASVQVVSYVGTGTYGSSNPNSLTFDFVPKLVSIQNEATPVRHMIATRNSIKAISNENQGYSCDIVWNSKTISWTSNSVTAQLNTASTTFRVVAIG